jgi:hypothetical protein
MEAIEVAMQSPSPATGEPGAKMHSPTQPKAEHQKIAKSANVSRDLKILLVEGICLRSMLKTR